MSEALALLLAREHQGTGAYREVALSEVAAAFAEPLGYGLTTPGGLLGGGLARYNLYPALKGWIAVAALEPHFWERLEQELELSDPGREELERLFLSRSAHDWERWAAARDLPIMALRGPSPIKKQAV